MSCFRWVCCRVFLVMLATLTAWPQGVIRLKTRSIVPAGAVVPERPGAPGPGAMRHYLVLFGDYPGPDVLTELAARRILVDAYVPENSLMVSAFALNLRGLDVLWSGPMDPADKISPAISNQTAGAYLVILQPDADSAVTTQLAEGQGFTVAPNGKLLTGQLLLSGAVSALPALAAIDAVAYILPASAQLQDGDAIVGCAGARTSFGIEPQYVEANHGWGRDTSGQVALQYFFDSVTPDVPESLVRSEIARAFATWAQYANISFTPASQPALDRSIDILFARYAHGDAYPFEGPNGVLAHTFYPLASNPEPVAGDMHLNADEPWSSGASAGGTVDIFSVALHEAGHALGLGHSDIPTAVMYPYYRLQSGLTADDIAGIQALYGAKAASVSPPVVTPPGSGTSVPSAPGTGSASPGAGPGTGASPGPDAAPPALTIVSPGGSIVATAAAAISMSGTASDNVGIASVAWSTSTGSTGTASGTASWSASVPLLVGNNTVTIRAYDAAGNSTWRAVTVVRQ